MLSILNCSLKFCLCTYKVFLNLFQALYLLLIAPSIVKSACEANLQVFTKSHKNNNNNNNNF